MYSRIILTLCLLFISLSSFAQVRLKLPTTIYHNFLGEKLASLSDNSTFKLDQFRFRIIDKQDIIRNSFVIDFANFGKKASILDYESYKNLALDEYFDRPLDLFEMHAFQYREWKQEQRHLKRIENTPKPKIGW